MAAKDDKDPKSAPAGTPRFDPKPVQVGGESLLERLIPYMKQILIGIGVTAVVLTVIFTIRYLHERKRQGETDKVAAVLDVAAKPVRPAGVPEDPKTKDQEFPDAKARAQAVLDALAKQGTDAVGPTYRASMLLEAGKVDEAIAEYRRGQGLTGLDGVLDREGLGIALEMKAEAEKDATARQKGLEEALAAFQSMQQDENGPRRAYALYHQGRILALLGKSADAKAAFEKAKELGKDGELPELIDERLASLGAS